MLKILMGPNVKILMGQSFGSWTHGHGPMCLSRRRGPWAEGPRPVGSGSGTRAQGQALGPGHGPMPMCPGAKALAHEYFDIWAHKYF